MLAVSRDTIVVWRSTSAFFFAAGSFGLGDLCAQLQDLAFHLPTQLLALIGDLLVENRKVFVVRIALAPRSLDALADAGGFFLERDQRRVIDPPVLDVRHRLVLADHLAGPDGNRCDLAGDRRGQQDDGSIDDGAIGFIRQDRRDDRRHQHKREDGGDAVCGQANDAVMGFGASGCRRLTIGRRTDWG